MSSQSNFKQEMKFLFFMIVIIVIISSTFVYFTQNINTIDDKKDMWFDESFTALFIQRSYQDLLSIPLDVHPPLYYITLKLFYDVTKNIFNNPYRTFSIIFGLLSVLSFHYIFLNFSYVKKQGQDLYFAKYLFMIVSVSILSAYTYYSNEARMYTFLMFLYSLSWGFYLKFDNCQNSDKNKYLSVHYILLAMCVLVHYYMIFGLLLFLLFVFIRRQKEFFKYVLNINSLLIWGVVLPYCFLYGIQQFKLMENLWLPKVSVITLFNTWLSYLFYSTDQHINDIYIMLFIFSILFIPILNISLKDKKITKKDLDAFALYYLSLFLPLIGIIISLFFGAYHHRYFMFCSVLFIPLLFYYIYDLMLSACKNKFFLTTPFIIIACIIIPVGFINTEINYNNELNTISKFLSENALDGDIIIHSSTFSMIPMMYYTNNTYNHYLISINVTQKQLNTAGGVIIKDRYDKIKVLNYVPELDYNSTCKLLNLDYNICHKKNIFYLNSYKDFYKNNSVTLLKLNGITVERVKMI